MGFLPKLGDDDRHEPDDRDLLLWPLLSRHLFLTCHELLRLAIFVAYLSAETVFLIQRWKLVFHVLALLSCFLAFFILRRIASNPNSDRLYLVDFSCLEPPCRCRVPFSTFLEHASMINIFDRESIDFMAKILASSGQSEETCLPPPLHYIPPKTSFDDSIGEVHMVLFPIMEDLLTKTKLSPRDIDILIVNCSGFCSSPSLSSIIINKFSMRTDVKSFNISGMGCSASALGVDLVKNLMSVHKNSNAVVLSTEILSTGWYSGQERAKLLLNCLFRMGSSAILLSNKREAKRTSKYKLLYTLRTQRSFDDKGYYSAYREEDSNGNLGVTLNRDLLQVAGETLRANITILGSEILPFTEKFWHGVSVLRKRFLDKSCEIHVPNFKRVVQHFCLPASGRPMIREIGKGLKLGELDMEAALMTLHRFGNQSSSSLWYELAYMEAKERIKKGDIVWQLGMGTGPKCTSIILECIRPIEGESKKGPWASCIHEYPVSMEEATPALATQRS